MTAKEPFPWKHLQKMLKQYALVWLGSSLLFTTIGITYTLIKTDQREANQPLLVRSAVAGALPAPRAMAAKASVRKTTAAAESQAASASQQ